MSAHCPYRWTGTIARVLEVTTCSTEAGSIVPASGSTSQSTGVAPARSMPETVGTHVFACVTTSSPGPMPSARSASSIASVPFAQPTACAFPFQAASSASNARPSSPSTNQPRSSTRAAAASSSGRIAAVARARSLNGTCTPRV